MVLSDIMKAMMNEISRQEAKPLFAALEKPLRLNLVDEDKLEVSHYIMNLLQTDPEGELFDSQTLDSLPYQEVIEAAA